MRAKLRVHGGEVRIHVQHAGIGVAQEADAALAHGARHGRRAAPIVDFAPRSGIVVKLARDHVEIDAGARKGVGDFRHAADRTVRQPFGGIGGFIVKRG